MLLYCFLQVYVDKRALYTHFGLQSYELFSKIPHLRIIVFAQHAQNRQYLIFFNIANGANLVFWAKIAAHHTYNAAL